MGSRVAKIYAEALKLPSPPSATNLEKLAAESGVASIGFDASLFGLRDHVYVEFRTEPLKKGASNGTEFLVFDGSKVSALEELLAGQDYKVQINKISCCNQNELLMVKYQRPETVDELIAVTTGKELEREGYARRDGGSYVPLSSDITLIPRGKTSIFGGSKPLFEARRTSTSMEYVAIIVKPDGKVYVPQELVAEAKIATALDAIAHALFDFISPSAN